MGNEIEIELPVPERYMDDRGYTVESSWLESDEASSDYRDVYINPIYTAQQVRAIVRAALAATPPAQTAVPVGFALVPLRITRAMDEVLREEGWQWEDLLAAANAVTEEQYEAIAHDRLSRDEVRAVLMEHGYTVKEGQTDLKPYVYEAAAELEDLVRSRLASAHQAQDVQRDADIQRAVLAERERICAAIKAEDDHCVTQGDYMLDSEDCIKVVRGEWVRPVYEIGGAASAAQGKQ